MTDLRKAAQQALEALYEETAWFGPTPKGAAAIAALKAALAQQDEPVWMHPWPPVRTQQEDPQTLDDALTLPRATAQAYENGYKAGVAAEREACAQVCEARFMGDMTREDMEARRCAAAIRERNNP